MPTFYLIRHAENDLTGRRLPGWLPGIHLNERGLAQARALAEILAPVKLAALYCSPLERARETAKPLAAAKGLQVRIRPDLGEVRVGRWEGESLHRLRRLKLWGVIQQAPSLARFPDGESFVEAQARVVAELEALRRLHPGPRAAIACVSHSDTLKLALAHYAGIPLDLFQRLTIEPASVSVLRVSDGHIRLLQLNDTRATRVVPSE
jgi:probable phosphoglycerate mutase